jgi:hypothetical protein
MIDDDYNPSARPGIDRKGKSKLNLLDAVDVDRLRDSMSWSAKQMMPFREQYVNSVGHYAGSRYGDQVNVDKTPVNLLRMAVEIWIRQLISQTPRALVLTRSNEMKVAGYELELALNFLMEKIRFGDNMAEVVRSAVFLLGAMKVGLSSQYMPHGSGYSSEGGQPYAEPILLEDFLYDFNARRQEEWDWCANRYRMPYDLVMDNPDYSKRARDRLSPTTERMSDDSPDSGSSETTSSLSSGNAITKTEYRKHVELWDVWIPGDNLFVTIPLQHGLEPLMVREWEGPEHGPYHLLAFSKVPGNIMPSAPAQHLFDLQELLTQLFNKLGRQAKRQKTITVASGQAVADGTAQRVMDAEDGQVLHTSHIDSVKEMNYGKVDPANLSFVVYLKELFSYMAGNLDAMGGLSQQGDTLGQEQLLVQSSSQMLQDMQAKVVTFTSEVIKDLSWYLYTDPFIELPLSKTIESFGEIPFIWGPGNRKHDFFGYDFRVEPYSLQHKGPQQRLSTIMQVVTQVLLPLAPQMSEWGLSLNLRKFVELVAKYSDLPELQELVSSDVPLSPEPGISKEQATPGRRPLQSPSTTRNYVRTNVSGGRNPQSQTADLMRSMMSGGGKEEGR